MRTENSNTLWNHTVTEIMWCFITLGNIILSYCNALTPTCPEEISYDIYQRMFWHTVKEKPEFVDGEREGDMLNGFSVGVFNAKSELNKRFSHVLA